MFEKQDQDQFYLPSSFSPRHISVAEFYEEMGKPASRFRSPLSLKEKIIFSFSSFAARHSPIKDLPVRLSENVPLNWKLILNYLYKEGVVEEPGVRFGSFRNDKPKKVSFSIQAAFNPKETDAKPWEIYGYGSDADPEQGISKAIGELLERYVGGLFKKSDFMQASIAQMKREGNRFLHPDAVSHFADWQRERFPEFSYTEETVFSWVKAEVLPFLGSAYVPAQLMVWLYHHTNTQEREPTLMPVTSNGLAGHFTKEEATIAAINEYVQRDSFLIFWLNTISPKRIDISRSDDPDLRALLSYLQRFGIEAHFLNVTTDIAIPTCVCVLVSDNEEDPVLAVGAGNGSHAKEALLSAYQEALFSQSTVANGRESHAFTEKGYEPFVRKDIAREERILFWHGKEAYEKAKFLWSGEIEPLDSFEKLFAPTLSPRERLADMLERLGRNGAGYEVYLYEMKHRVLSRLGYHVVKVIIPQLLSLHLNEHVAMLGAPRLSEVPKKLGYTKTLLNTWPHPFP